jgi:ABC-type branched-subunit amino acid transport system permease subunit
VAFGDVYTALVLWKRLGLGELLSERMDGSAAKVTGSEYSLLTFAWQLVWFAAVLNWRPVTGAALGLSGVPPIIRLPEKTSLAALCVITLCLAVGVHWLWRIASQRPFLRSCRVIVRSNELALTIGLPVGAMRLGIGLVYGLVLGIAGVLLVSYLSIVEPGQFAISTSITILAVGLFAQSHNRWIGPLVGAMLLVGLPELIRFLGVSVERAGFIQLALSGTVGAVFAIALLGRDGN